MSHSCLAGVKDFANRGGKIPDTRARHDDGVPPPVRFLGDSEKLSAIVLTKLHVETLPFDLELLCLDDAVHFRKTEQSRAVGLSSGSKICGSILSSRAESRDPVEV